MELFMPHHPHALLLCVALIACNDKGTDTTDAETDVETETDIDTDPPVDTDVAIDTDPPVDTDDTDMDGVRLRGIVMDFSTKAPLEGVAYSGEGYSGTTDASGEFRIWVPAESDTLISLTADGYPRHDLYQWAGMGNSYFNNVMMSDATIAQLAAALQLTHDPTKCIISVSLSEWDGNASSSAHLAGVTVGMDATYDVALATDASSPYGVSPGTTTLAGGGSEVTFVNVPAGEVTLTITPPEGYVCPYGQTTIEAIAGGVVNPAINCIPE
jgi:hypothetical protein